MAMHFGQPETLQLLPLMFDIFAADVALCLAQYCTAWWSLCQYKQAAYIAWHIMLNSFIALGPFGPTSLPCTDLNAIRLYNTERGRMPHLLHLQQMYEEPGSCTAACRKFAASYRGIEQHHAYGPMSHL